MTKKEKMTWSTWISYKKLIVVVCTKCFSTIKLLRTPQTHSDLTLPHLPPPFLSPPHVDLLASPFADLCRMHMTERKRHKTTRQKLTFQIDLAVQDFKHPYRTLFNRLENSSPPSVEVILYRPIWRRKGSLKTWMW